jgi:hypothetical protein
VGEPRAVAALSRNNARSFHSEPARLGLGDGFLVAQVTADTKRVEPLLSAPDVQTFALSGPGSRIGMNFVLGRKAEASWRKNDRDWYQRLAELHALIAPRYATLDLPVPNYQDLQNQLCEFAKYFAVSTGLRATLKRAYKPALEPKPKAIKSKTTSTRKSKPGAPITGIMAASEAPDTACITMTSSPPLAPSAEIIPFKATTPKLPSDNDRQDRHNSAAGSPHGSAGPPRGEPKATWFYDSLDQELYLLVEKRIAANGDRNFYQYHWTGVRWVQGVKGTYAERKVPYQLRALKAALRADPNVLVHITEGEKDADTLRRLGLVATTNPGGANHWNDDLTAWLRLLGARYIVVHEDNDKAGRDRTKALAAALSRFASVRVVQYPDVPDGEDVTYWVDEQHHSKAELEARIAAAKPVSDAIDFTGIALTAQDWLARDLAEPDLLMGHMLSTTVRALLNATTGIGKTNFSMALFGHIGAGKDFLHWRCPRPRHVLYIDGEMSRKLFRDRIADVVRRLGAPPVGTYFFNKADVENFAPLNTPEGQAAIWQLIAEIERRSGQKLDAVCFDSIMALLLGDMKEEDAWRDTMPLVYALTKRQIGQLWVHHTGHDTSRGYGTKTREWQLDTVMHLDEIKRPDTDASFALTFPKARERTPDNRVDFATVDIALVNDQWMGAVTTNVKAKISEPLTLKFFEALQHAADTSSIAATSGQPTATLEEWRAQCVSQGLLDQQRNVRAAFSKYKLKLIAANWIACNAELAWILP